MDLVKKKPPLCPMCKRCLCPKHHAENRCGAPVNRGRRFFLLGALAAPLVKPKLPEPAVVGYTVKYSMENGVWEARAEIAHMTGALAQLEQAIKVGASAWYLAR